MYNSFYFKGDVYDKGAIIQIYKEYEKKFGFHSHLVFEEYDDEKGICHFCSLYSCWDRYEIPIAQLNDIIESVIPAYSNKSGQTSHKVEEKYIEGIISAWTWYIVIMFLALFLKGASNVILTWIVASVIFFSWRRKKLNGG